MKGHENTGHSSAGTFELRRARYFSETGAPMLQADQQHSLTNLVDEVDPGMKHNMIVQNLRIVVSIARSYTNRGLEFVDLVRAGNQGLMQAMEKFEPAGGFCFTTFVTWCVSQKIELALMQQNKGSTCQQTDQVPLISFGNTETCPEYPSGCSRSPA
jgi:RNA polymerase nonessential primary-like sigma factor